MEDGKAGMRLDLHLHSTASDGTTPPQELARLAAEQGLQAIALTDHDTVEGLAPCAAECTRQGLRFVPGVELSAGGDREIHVLGYHIDPQKLRDSLQSLRGDRFFRMERMVARIREAGMDVTIQDVEQIAGGAPLGRPHVAMALVRKGYASSVKNAFERYLGDGRPCCVPREKMGVARAVEWIHTCGGAAVIAHPALIRCERRMLTQTLAGLLDMGADGIEAFHSAHTPADARELEAFARRHGALVTGGSDFHGRVKDVGLEQGLVHWHRREEDFARLQEFAAPYGREEMHPFGEADGIRATQNAILHRAGRE